jgi:hypothetical protein
MDRLANWDSHLVGFARGVVGEDFEWGTTDCASLVRRGLIAMMGEDVWKKHVRIWKTRRGALAASKKTEPEHVLEVSGAVKVGTKFAWAGDVAMGKNLDDHNMVQLSLLLPTRKALTSTPDRGVIIVDKLSLTEGTGFWRYGG